MRQLYHTVSWVQAYALVKVCISFLSEHEAMEFFFYHCLNDQCRRLGRTIRGPFFLTDLCVMSIWPYKTSQLMLWLCVPNQHRLSLSCQSTHSLFFIVSCTPLIQFKMSLIRLHLMPGEELIPLLGLLILSSSLTTLTRQVKYLSVLKVIFSCSSPCVYIWLSLAVPAFEHFLKVLSIKKKKINNI